MFLRDFLETGNYVVLVPFGLPLTVQYDERGMLEKLLTGFHSDSDQVDITDELLPGFLDNDIVPRTVPIKDGTTWISGVLYTGKKFGVDGQLPKCLESSIIEDFKANPLHYNYFAGSVDSFGVTFTTSSQRKSWLSVAEFKTLPGLVITAELTEDNFEKIASTYSENFVFPYFSDYLVFVNGQCIHYNLGFKQYVVKDVDVFDVCTGHLFGTIVTSEDSILTSYRSIVENNVTKGSVVLQSEDGDILKCYDVEGKLNKFEMIQCCKVCGAPIEYDEIACNYRCSNYYCTTRMYPVVLNFVSTLNLPAIDEVQYGNLNLQNAGCVSILDVLADPIYRELELKCSLETFIRAMLPYSVVRKDSNVIAGICGKCNNTPSTLEYFLNGHVDKLLEDLPAPASLIEWLNDVENIYELQNVLKKFTIVSQERKFEGSPIFRNKLICITGRFMHGSASEIKSIFRSYDADVTEHYSEGVDYVVVGDTKEDVNGVYIRQAKYDHVPVVSESEFFNAYEIDDDLRQNLL